MILSKLRDTSESKDCSNKILLVEIGNDSQANKEPQNFNSRL